MIPTRHRMQGFTAVELMIVVLIVGILTALAAPNMAAMVRNQRVKTAAFDLNASLVFARSEALKRNVAVTITPTAAADWTRGWTITDANNTVLKQEQDRNLNANELVFTGPAAVTYARNGRLNAALATPFSLSAPKVPTDKHRCITLDLSGRPSTKEGAC